MSVETIPFDGTEFMGTPEAQAYLIADAMESGDPVYIRHALNTIARARGMTQIANEAGVAREALYRALSPEGDPRMSTLFGVLNALGLRLSVAPSREPSVVIDLMDALRNTISPALPVTGLVSIPAAKAKLNRLKVRQGKKASSVKDINISASAKGPRAAKEHDVAVEARGEKAANVGGEHGSSKKAKGTRRQASVA